MEKTFLQVAELLSELKTNVSLADAKDSVVDVDSPREYSCEAVESALNEIFHARDVFEEPCGRDAFIKLFDDASLPTCRKSLLVELLKKKVQ